MILAFGTVFGLILASAFFVAAEFALIAARRSQVEPRAVRSARARATLAAMDEVSVMMASAQLGITVTGIVLGAVGEPAVAHLIEPLLSGWNVPEGLADTVSLIIALTLVVAAHVAFGEMVPKNIALASPEATALLLAPLLRGVTAVLGPVVRGLDALANLVVRALGVTPKSEVASTFTRAEMSALISESARAGLLDAEEELLLGSALGFQLTTVADVMVADRDVIAVGPRPAPAEVEAACARSGFSRFPVRGADDYEGFIHVRDVLAAPEADREQPVDPASIHPLPVISADTSLTAALETMQRTRTHMCRVVEAGRGVGIALLEDVIEMLVGEIVDATRRRPPSNGPAASLG